MENELSNSQEWVIGEVNRLKVENAKLSLDRRELAEHLSEAGRFLESLNMPDTKFMAAKYVIVVERVME